MKLAEWNVALLEWFFTRHPAERAYLRVDDAELKRMSDRLRLRCDNPAEDLILAVQEEVRNDPALRWQKRKGEEWRQRGDATESPPWLGLLAVSVLVAARGAEHGRTAFYEPLSEALGFTRVMDQEDYRATFYEWWFDLGRWLNDTNHGERGLPSWKRIPESGMRSFIGHPYTQILLKREDFRDVDAFLASLGALEPGDLEVTNQAAAGEDLIDRFARWASRRRVSVRLWSILTGTPQQPKDSLKYILLDRFMDEVEPYSGRILEHEAQLVVTLDDWVECRLRFSVIGPPSMETWATKTLKVEGELLGPLEVGAPWPTEIPVNPEALQSGVTISTPEDVDLVYRPSEVVVLAVRAWSVWCSVDDVEVGETIYLLVAEEAMGRLAGVLNGFPPSKAIQDVPSGWRLFGPGPLTAPTALEESQLPLRRPWQAVPRLVGGLEVARHTYLLGGPPDVFIPSSSGRETIRLDGTAVGAEPGGDSLLKISGEALGPGLHRIDIGPYRLRFEMLSFESVATVQEEFGRTALGDVVPTRERDGQVVFCGAARLPPVSYEMPLLVALDVWVVLLGDWGTAVECTGLTSAPWALAIGLPQVAIEPAQRSSYVGGKRPMRSPRWIAMNDSASGAWSLALLRGSDQAEVPEAANSLAREVVLSIGATPTFVGGRSQEKLAILEEEWRRYSRIVIE